VYTGLVSLLYIYPSFDTATQRARNKTVACDEATANLAAQGMDENWWYKENITTLCTADCSSSVNAWLKAVDTDCASDTVTQANIVVKARTIPLQYTYGYSLACLQNKYVLDVFCSLKLSTNSSSAKDWCFLKSQTWSGSDYIRYDSAMCLVDDPPAICDQEDFEVEQLDPTLQTITNLYSSSLLCDECFLKIWRQRLLSPFVIAGNWTQYRVNQFDAMQKNCSTSLPYSTSAATLFVGTANASMIPTPTSGIIPINTGITVAPTCTGQVVQPSTSPLTCNDLSDLYHVSTGDLQVATKDSYCSFSKAVCLPLGCEIKTIEKYGETCASLATQISNATRKVTEQQFFGWNQNIQGSCDDLAIDQRICIRYVLSPPY